MPPRKLAALRAGLVKFGFAGTFLVRAEDGLLIGGHRRFEIALDLIPSTPATSPNSNGSTCTAGSRAAPAIGTCTGSTASRSRSRRSSGFLTPTRSR
jgi:hypothetical protein